MYPPSPYAVPLGSFQRPVAIPATDSLEGPFFYIGINCDWMPLIAGSLKQLLLQATWDTTDVNALQKVQGQVFNLIAQFNCATAPSLSDLCGVAGAGGGEDCMCCLRVQNGVLQTLNCGVWEDVPGQPPGGFFNTPQPSDQQPLPQPGGGCQQYHASMPGNGIWLLPAPVSTGDTIDVTGMTGISYDSVHVGWYCPGGEEFILGVCTGLTVLEGADPLPSVPHMKLVAKIGSTFYDVQGGIFTVPGGISSQQVVFQVNDDTLSGNGGNLTFDVLLCNNSTGALTVTYTHGSGPTGVFFGSVFAVTSASTGGDERIDIAFSQPVKMSILAQSGYVNVGTPGPSNVWAGWQLGGTQVGTLVDPPATVPTDFPANQVVDSLGMDTAGPGATFSITVQIQAP